MKNSFFKYILTGIGTLALLPSAQAQSSDFTTNYLPEIVLSITVAVALVILVMLVVIYHLLKSLLPQSEAQNSGEAAPAASAAVSWWNSINAWVPVAKEQEVLTDHAYDGIKELDNKLPPWWVAMFYITIIFGVGYLLHYHLFKTGPDQETEYSQQMADAEKRIKAYQASLALSIDENNVEFTDEALALAEGKEIYISKCAACHANDGGGGVGPNLTDNYWIHGGDIKNVFKTVKYGVPQKGMISWSNQLTPVQMQNVSSFILTFLGTTPANPKEPQGELYMSNSAEAVSGE